MDDSIEMQGNLKPELHGIAVPANFFRAVQLSGIFRDSKTFVDRPAKFTCGELASQWEDFRLAWDGSDAPLRSFVEKTTSPEGSDLLRVLPRDWKEKQHDWLRDALPDDALRQWAQFLHRTWTKLCFSTQFPEKDAALHTLLHLPRPFFVPGDRFRELYYWDSHWTVMGLMVSGMYESAIDQVECLLSLLERYGFVPNGGRRYYTNRSQPPLLSITLRVLLEEISDSEKVEEATKRRVVGVVERAVPALIREHRFWTTSSHGVTVVGPSGRSYALSRYHAQTDQPRPEAFKEDLATLEAVGGEGDALFRDITSAAESGHDFSSRWFSDPTSLSTIQTTRVAPVDLNAFLYAVECNISHFASLLGGEEAQETVRKYQRYATRRQAAFDELFWDNQTHRWCDAVSDRSGDRFVREGYLSDDVPLACGVALPAEADASRVVHRLRTSLFAPGGCVTSLYETGQQWDAPNVWPPLQCLVVDGLVALEKRRPGAGAEKLAEEIAVQFLANAFHGYEKCQCMFEKYQSHRLGHPGNGGEYVTQSGFGWTNGVALWLLRTYGHKMQTTILD